MEIVFDARKDDYFIDGEIKKKKEKKPAAVC